MLLFTHEIALEAHADLSVPGCTGSARAARTASTSDLGLLSNLTKAATDTAAAAKRTLSMCHNMNAKGMAPIHVAAYHGQAQVVEILLQCASAAEAT